MADLFRVIMCPRCGFKQVSQSNPLKRHRCKDCKRLFNLRYIDSKNRHSGWKVRVFGVFDCLEDAEKRIEELGL